MTRVGMTVTIAVAVGAACGEGERFLCTTDLQCERQGAAGQCEYEGYCSFEDAECESGRRYGEFAGAGLALECVAPVAATTGSETSGASTGEASAGTTGGTTLGAAESGSSTGEVDDPDLVLWLRFDDPLDPVADSSIYASTLTCDPLTCPPPSDVGPVGSAAVFDGVGAGAVLAYDPVLETTDAFTVAVWVRNDAIGNTAIKTVTARPFGDAADNTWEIYFRDEGADSMTDLTFELADDAGVSYQLSVPDIVPAAPWIHVAATWDGATASLWVDREVVDSVEVTGLSLDASPTLIGHDIDSGSAGNFFVGALDDLRVYRRALTADELAALP